MNILISKKQSSIEFSQIVVTFAVLFTLTLCFSSCGTGQGQTGMAQASLAHGETIKELKQHSNFVVSGVISNIGPVVKTDFPYSEVTLSVKKVLWQAQTRTSIPSTIIFNESGGKDAFGTTYVAEDDPLYSVGQHVILFITQSNSGNYSITDVPFGRFIIENNKVTPVENDGIVLPANINEQGFKEILNVA